MTKEEAQRYIEGHFENWSAFTVMFDDGGWLADGDELGFTAQVLVRGRLLDVFICADDQGEYPAIVHGHDCYEPLDAEALWRALFWEALGR